jgi:hypothetical protein
MQDDAAREAARLFADAIRRMPKAYRTDVHLSSKRVFTVFKKGVIFWAGVFAPATHVAGVRRWRLEGASA